jgi:hypothetical protein
LDTQCTPVIPDIQEAELEDHLNSGVQEQPWQHRPYLKTKTKQNKQSHNLAIVNGAAINMGVQVPLE